MDTIEKQLYQELEEAGLRLQYLSTLSSKMRGAYDAQNNPIYIRTGMSYQQTLETIAHELEHAKRGDQGHQDSSVEKRINYRVAQRFFTLAQYARAEENYGCDAVALSQELGVTLSLLKDFQEYHSEHAYRAVS